ncbi:MAG: putative amidohydrolase YtcJ, partial [Candidatus Azotimanducaceae bacterium]
LYVMVRGSNVNLAAHLDDHYRPLIDNEFLTVRSIKRQIDGALGSHGAWLLEPYEDLTDTSGLVLETIADIEETARLAVAAGYQLNTHAIGTRANREVLDLYERVWSSAEVTGQALRWRIEHAQHIHADDIPRFAQLGVIASIQGVHATSDGPWIASRLGEERTEQTSYRWRDLLDSGAMVNNGTDVPVESIDPFASIYASVARTMNTGETFYPDQAMTRYEALYSYTMANAYAAFEEHAKGSLTPGKLADLVVIDQDILTIDAERILKTKVHYTIVGGEVRYQRASQ